MKKISLVLICFVILLLNKNANSQLAISDYFNDFILEANNDSYSSNCLMQSTAFLSKYGNQSYYIPNASSPQLKTVMVNFNIIQKDDGTGNFTTSATDLANLNNIKLWLQESYQYNDQPSDPLPGVPFIPDTYIRFEINIYFYQNTSLWNSSNYTALMNMVRTSYPGRLNQVNIFFTEGDAGGASGFTSSLPSHSNYALEQGIVTFHKYNGGNTVGYYATAMHLAHEMGHVFGLLHTYYASCCPETCDETNRDYLDDALGIDGINTGCWHEAGWTCDPYAAGNTCTNNMMGGANISGYFSPKQIGRMLRCLSISSTRRYVKDGIYYNYPLQITSNENWDFNTRMYTDIIVESGAVLTITCKVLMPDYSKIIIKPGGKLIVDGGTITNSCTQHMWQGVQVWGNTASNQFPNTSDQYQQGYLELKNNATIENAICAVDLWKPNDYTKTGGMVIATNSNFINNTNSVHAAYYVNHHPTNGSEMDNITNFTNCTFSLNQNYIPANTFYKHVDLALVRGVKFNGCDFSLANDATAVSEWNQAISSYSSSFYVNATCTSPTMPCTSYDKCTFTGFNWGIKVTKDETSTRTFSVNRAVFSNNTFGIHVTGVRNESILNSEFVIGNNHAYCTNAQGYGIYLDNSTGFAIEENTFTKMAGAPQANYFGVQVNNCNGIDDVYKNTLTGLSYANYASSHDWVTPFTYNGLEWNCNLNSNNYADFYVASVPVSGIQAFQGQSYLAAGNTFSSNASWHFYNAGTHLVNYYYNPSISAQVPHDSKINSLVNKISTTANNTCPSHYGGGSSAISSIVLSDQQKLDRELQYASALTDYTNVKTLYDNLKDGGSTDAKLADIETAQPQDMWALRTDLLGSSPHLSKEVLIKVADKTSVFTESVIFDILSANPDELKNEDLMKYLEDKDNPLPQYMIDILRQVATGTSYKTVLQQQMALYNRSKTRAANDMIRSYLNDTATDYAQLRNWLDNLGGIEADRQIVASYAQEGNYNSALSLANAMPQLYNLQGAELTEHTQYLQLLVLQQTLQNENRSITMLTEPEIADLAAIAEINKSSAGATAKGILETFYSKHFCDCPEVAGTTSFKNSKVDLAELGKIYGLNITAKPNPATDWVAFDYTLPENEGSATLTLTDITGKIVELFNLNGQQGQKVWDTRDIKPGTYIYTLKVASFSKTGKIVISK